MLIAFITINRGLVPLLSLIEDLCAQIYYVKFENIIGFPFSAKKCVEKKIR